MEAQLSTSIFEAIDSQEGEAETEVLLGGQLVQVRLEWHGFPFGEAQRAEADRLLNATSRLDARARSTMRREDAESEDSVLGLFRAHHLREFPSDVLHRLHEVVDWGSNPNLMESGLILKLVVVDIGKQVTVHLDYRVPDDVSDYVIAVQFDQECRLVRLEMES